MRCQLEYLEHCWHLSKVFMPTNQSENERSARHQFPSILSKHPLCNAACSFMEGQIKRRNFETEIETSANKWSKLCAPSTETVYGTEGPLSGL